MHARYVLKLAENGREGPPPPRRGRLIHEVFERSAPVAAARASRRRHQSATRADSPRRSTQPRDTFSIIDDRAHALSGSPVAPGLIDGPADGSPEGPPLRLVEHRLGQVACAAKAGAELLGIAVSASAGTAPSASTTSVPASRRLRCRHRAAPGAADYHGRRWVLGEARPSRFAKSPSGRSLDARGLEAVIARGKPRRRDRRRHHPRRVPPRPARRNLTIAWATVCRGLCRNEPTPPRLPFDDDAAPHPRRRRCPTPPTMPSRLA
jgi:hypothetical protein